MYRQLDLCLLVIPYLFEIACNDTAKCHGIPLLAIAVKHSHRYAGSLASFEAKVMLDRSARTTALPRESSQNNSKGY